MSEQLDALQLAECLEDPAYLMRFHAKHAAVELRRLHNVNAQLLEALKSILKWMPVYPAGADGIAGGREAHGNALASARAAIARAEGKQ